VGAGSDKRKALPKLRELCLAKVNVHDTALVELDEGPRVLTNLRNCAPSDAKVGMRVSVIFEELTPEVTLPPFEPE